MLKISSKSVPGVAAVALLAGVFSVTSVQAAEKTCTKSGGAGSKPSCTTAGISFAKNATIYFGGASMTDGDPQGNGQMKVLRDNVSIAAKSFVYNANSSVKADKTTTYKTLVTYISYGGGILGPNKVKGAISTSPTNVTPF